MHIVVTHSESHLAALFCTYCRDFGHLSCLAMNEMGSMKEGGGGCVFHVTAAGPPQPPTGCLILNQTTDLLQVTLFFNKGTASGDYSILACLYMVLGLKGQ